MDTEIARKNVTIEPVEEQLQQLPVPPGKRCGEAEEKIRFTWGGLSTRTDVWRSKMNRALSALLVSVALISLPGCAEDEIDEKETAGMLRAASSTLGRQAEEKGELHEAERNYEMAVEYNKKEGQQMEAVHENLHRVRGKIKQKYGEE